MTDIEKMIIQEIRMVRKDVVELRRDSIVMTTKFKIVTVITSSIFGILGSIIVLYFKKNL